MSERRRVFPLADGEMAGIEWGDEGRPIDVLWIHANGFNASTYRSILAPLGERLRVLAIDLRGHGRSTLPAAPRFHRDWGQFRDDLAALLDALDGPPVVVAGHSMGGTTGLLAAARRPARVRAMALFDPVIMGRPMPLFDGLPSQEGARFRRSPITRGALRRRADFDSREQTFAAYRGRGAFRTWPDAVLADYLDDGLRDRPGGGVTLSCAPLWEASNFAVHSVDPWRAIRHVRAPTIILRAEHASTCRIGPGFVARAAGELSVETSPGTSHFLPMERPERVRDALLAVAASRP